MIALLDVVALLEDAPDYGLRRGAVGTVVEVWSDSAYEVEFSDNRGQTYAQLAVSANQLLVLHFEPEQLQKATHEPC